MTSLRAVITLGAFILGNVGLPAQAETVPSELASLAAQLYQQSKGKLEGVEGEPSRTQARKRALWALKRVGIPNWTREPVKLRGAATTLARLLDLDLSDEADSAFVSKLLAAPIEERPAALKDFYKGRGEPKTDAEINELLGAVAEALASVAPDLTARRTIEVAEGEVVEIEWNRETQHLVVKAASDGSGVTPEYETALIGRTTLNPDPATGNLDVGLEPGQRPPRVFTAEDLQRIRGSILGEWVDQESGDVYRLTAASERTGDVRPTREWYEREISKLRERLRRTENAKEYVWEDRETGEIIRQQRYRNLGAESYRYMGEEFLIEDAEERIAALRAQIADLEAERDGAGALPMDQHDPVGLGENESAPDARSIQVQVTREDGYVYTYDHASFDGRRVAAKRTYRDIRDADNEDLPPEVKQQLIASWSPPGWLELEAAMDLASGDISLAGARWGLHVTYSAEGGNTVKRIHTPTSYPVALGKKTGQGYRTAWGAAREAVP